MNNNLKNSTNDKWAKLNAEFDKALGGLTDDEFLNWIDINAQKRAIKSTTATYNKNLDTALNQLLNGLICTRTITIAKNSNAIAMFVKQFIKNLNAKNNA